MSRAETNPACSRETLQAQRKLGLTNADGKWQLGSPTAANDERTQNVTGYKRRAPDNASKLYAAVRHNADKEKEKAVEANLWTRVSSPCPKWRRRRLAAAAKPRSGAGTASSSASKLWRKGEDKCPGTIEAHQFAVQSGI